MEHPCYKCGANVEDGTPFCPRCNAPQIRVAGLEPLTPGATPPNVMIEHATPPYTPQLQSAIEWHQALRCAGLSLIVAVFLIALVKSAPLGMLAAGFLSVVLYRRRCLAAHVTAAMGARLGALTGALGFVAIAATLALWTAFRSSKEIHDAFLSYLQQNAQSSDPRMQQVLDLFNTPEGFTFIMIFSLILTLAAFLIFSSMGGAIAAFLLHRKDRP